MTTRVLLVLSLLLPALPCAGKPSKKDAARPAASPPAPAAAEPVPIAENAVAVLEYRNAVEHAGDLAGQVAQALGRNTSLKVLDPREGRQRLGPRLDAEVAACAGDVACLAGVGRRLGVREVLLAAVSQLGDVVVALQRVDVVRRAVIGRVADSLPAGQQVDEARVLGWLQQLYPPETFKRYGQIRVTTDVEGVQLYINAKPRGKTPLAPVQVLAPGNYRLLLERPRFLPFQAAVSVMPDTTVEVAAHLTPELRATPWYRRWYVWTAIGAGAVAAVSAGLAIYYGAFNQGPADMTRVPGYLDLK